MMEVRIKPTRILYFNEENFFGIYSCKVHEDDVDKVKLNKQWGTISIKGVMPKLEMKTEYTVVIKEDFGSNYEGSYIVESVKQDKPVTIEQQRDFLLSILTPTQVENIYEVYRDNEDIVEMIERNEFDYTKVKGIGEKTFKKLREKIMSNVDMGEILAFCKKFDIKYNMVAKLVEEYKNPAIALQKIKSNPYQLTEVRGIGFKKADSIAKAIGYSMTSNHRIKSAIKHIIEEENQSGHSWIEFKTLLSRAVDLLNIDKKYIIDVLNNDIKGVIKIDNRYTMKKIFEAETFVSMRMTQFKTQSKKVFETEEIDRFLDEYCERNNVELEENQRQFFHDWNENAILMLIGGGGMGR